MRKPILVFALVFLTTSHSLADGNSPKTRFNHCALLTWPDGQQTKLASHALGVEFVEVCASQGGCKINDKIFTSMEELHKALTAATLECLFPYAQVVNNTDSSNDQLKHENELKNKIPNLSTACQVAFLDPGAPIFPRVETACASGNEQNKNWCLANKLATYHLRIEQRGEFANIRDILLHDCPEPQLREYLKLRLYYLASQLDPDELAGLNSYDPDFDFGPANREVLDGIRPHINNSLQGKEYEVSINKHHPRKHLLIQHIDARCIKAQQDAPVGRSADKSAPRP